MAATESLYPEKSAVTENPETAKPTAHGSGFLSCVYITFTDVTEGDYTLCLWAEEKNGRSLLSGAEERAI